MIINNTFSSITLLYTNNILSHTISNYAINHIKSSYVIKSFKEKELKTQKAKATDGQTEREK